MRYVFLVFLALQLFVGCDSADQQTARQVNSQQDIYNQTQPLHTYDWSLERQAVQQLYDFRITRAVSTWSVWYSSTGQVIDGCPSKGFGIPYNTSMTNPEQYLGAGGSIPQAEPNGLYPGGSTDATWVLCVEPSGQVFPQYVEPSVIVYTWPVEIVRDEAGRPLYVRRTGPPDPKTAIDLQQPAK
jgi:hypothetical protein